MKLGKIAIVAASLAASPGYAELSSDTVFNILAAEIGALYGEVDSSASRLADAAIESEDLTLLRRSLEFVHAAQDWERVQLIAEKIFALEPGDARAGDLLGHAYQATGRHQEALEVFLKVVEEHGTGVAAFASLATELEADPSDAAIEIVDQLRAQYKDNDDTLRLAARLYLTAGRYDIALETLDKAIDRAPQVMPWYLAKYYTAKRSGDAELAEEVLQEAMAAGPDDLFVVETFFRTRIEQQADNAEVEAAYWKLAELQGRDPNALVGKLEYAMDSGYSDFASEAIVQLEMAGLPDVTIRLLQAKLAENFEDYDSALAIYQGFGEDDAGYEIAVVYRAYLLQQMGREQEAIDSLDAKINGQSKYADIERFAITKLDLLEKTKRVDEALASTNHWLQQFGDHAPIYFQRGLVSIRQGDFSAFERDMRKTIELDLSHAQARNALGYELVDRNLRLDEAGDLIQQAINLKPGDAAFIDSLGWWQFRKGELQSAQRTLRRAYSMMRDPEIGAHLGEVLWELGRTEEATRLWAELAAEYSDHSVLQDTMERFLR